MHLSSRLLAAAATFSSALAYYQGFNYGAVLPNGTLKLEGDFEIEFRTARALVGAPGNGFTSARLYTMRQQVDTQQSGPAVPISAIPAAIATRTSLLLGLWCSAGDAIFDKEIEALAAAISQYGTNFAQLVAGISVGSEDLYRNSEIGVKNNAGRGAEARDIARYIKRVKEVIAGTPLASAPVGHVDTWTAWVNSSNQEVINSCDWIGMDAYPYFQSTTENSIANSKGLFDKAVRDTQAAVGNRPIWITETGFPISGKVSNQAVPSLENSKRYWDEVGCSLFGKTNVWWYTLFDGDSKPSFSLISDPLKNVPLFDISCEESPESSATDASGASSTAGDGSSTSQPAPNSTVSGTPRPSATPETNPNAAPSLAGPIMAAVVAATILAAVVAAL